MKFSRSISIFLSRSSSIYRQVRLHWHDVLSVFTLAAAVGFVVYQGTQFVNLVIFNEQTPEVWFHGNTSRIFINMTARRSSHDWSKAHTLSPLSIYSLIYVLKKASGIDSLTAVRIVIAAVAFLWSGALFMILRLIGCQRFDAILFSALAATNVGMFWFVIPETYPNGSLSILLALCLVAAAQHRGLSPFWYVLVSALTLSSTITNWMVGIFATIVNHRWKQSLQIIVSAFCLVLLLIVVQEVFIRGAALKALLNQREELNYIFKPESGDPLQVIKQGSTLGLRSLWAIVVVVSWTALLGIGLWGSSVRQYLQLRIFLGLTLFGLVCNLYEEISLYTLYFAPLLVVLAALSTLTRARPLALVLAGILVLAAGINNSWQFSQATEFFQGHGLSRQVVRVQMQQRPTDPWPRGTGHVVLAALGSREIDKAYHEPGGSFSPAVGSFGVSLWLTDVERNLKNTSDNIPLSGIHQQLIWTDDQDIPGILTETSYYQALWSSIGSKRWQLNLKTQANTDTKLMVVIRSVGPAGGPIRSLDWDGQRLLINNRWSVKSDSALTKLYLGQEGTQDWKIKRSPLSQWKGDNGWGYARFEIADSSDWNLIIEDSISAPTIGLSTTEARSTLELNLPDKRFTDSLNAQVAHLMMSVVDRQTRPGEPTNYPLPWLRDGAYAVVALARAGQLEVAKELSTYFAENDFFGGFGPEADAPGLGIWALVEVAERLDQPGYNQWLWPHIHRKAEFIFRMLATNQPIHQTVTGPIVPERKDDPDLTLVAEPARNGLIVGRMDNHRPLLFVNAVSYRGLIDAAALADKVNQPADAKRWRTKAANLKQAWEKAFIPPEAENDRTYISSLWPTWVAASRTDALSQGLQRRWTKLRNAQGGFRSTPLWTYFDIAEAHQWLFLNQPERVWATLRWFWEHQASPGLYTWWEGNGEENSFHRWEHVRGWVNPPYVTPHYWTAAEMLLLQLDMLAYIDQAVSKPTVVLAAGIPVEWLDKPMSVRGLPILNGEVDWSWDGKQMRVKLRNKSSSIDVKLGKVFHSSTPLSID